MQTVSPFMQDLQLFLQALLVPIAGVIAAALMKRAGIAQDAQSKAVVDTAIQRGVGLMLKTGVDVADPLLTKMQTRNVALNQAMDYVNNVAASHLDRLKINGEQLGQKLGAELAIKLQPFQPVGVVVASTKT